MTRNDLVAVFGSQKAVADFFVQHGIPMTKGAISQWESVPELREYQIRQHMPDIDERIAAMKKPRRRSLPKGNNGHQERQC
jgi:hypothetical protein